jgi:hypothetical protein
MTNPLQSEMAASVTKHPAAPPRLMIDGSARKHIVEKSAYAALMTANARSGRD